MVRAPSRGFDFELELNTITTSLRCFIGFPSVGKSTLLTNLAGVYSEVAAYEFTTLTTVPGVIRFKGAKIQVSALLTNVWSIIKNNNIIFKN